MRPHRNQNFDVAAQHKTAFIKLVWQAQELLNKAKTL
jgi:hypothetical protein